MFECNVVQWTLECHLKLGSFARNCNSVYKIPRIYDARHHPLSTRNPEAHVFTRAACIKHSLCACVVCRSCTYSPFYGGCLSYRQWRIVHRQYPPPLLIWCARDAASRKVCAFRKAEIWNNFNRWFWLLQYAIFSLLRGAQCEDFRGFNYT